jgi:hypothetical protein
MKTMKTLILFLLFSQMAIAQGRIVLHFITYGNDLSEIYIDSSLQTPVKSKQFIISNIPRSSKSMTIHTYAGSKTINTIPLNHTADLHQYYSLTLKDGTYKLKQETNPFVMSIHEGITPLGYRVPQKPRTTTTPTNEKFVHSCELSDSAVNVIIFQMNQLKSPKAKELVLKNGTHLKCLLTHQISALTNKIESDSAKFEEFKKYYLHCNDKANFSKLMFNLKSELYVTAFRYWLGAQR